MIVPPRNRRNSPSEQTDEAPGAIEDQQVDVERDVPIGENEPVERTRRDEALDPPAFEE